MFCKLKNVFSLVVMAALIAAVLTCGAAFGEGEEEEDFNNANPVVINENPGGVYFLRTPSGISASVDATMKANNFVNVDEYTNSSDNTTALYNDGDDEIEGTGFTFDIKLSGVPEGKTAVIGYGKPLYLTPDNYGTEGFADMVAALRELPDIGGGYVVPENDMMKDFGILFKAIGLDGKVRDITDYASFGVMVIDDNTIMIFYGNMLADRAVTDNEGEELMLSFEDGQAGTESMLSDGKADGHLAITCYLAKAKASTSRSGGSSGCNFGLSSCAALALAGLLLFCKK